MSDIDELEVTGPIWREYKVTVELISLPDSTTYVVHVETDEGENLGTAEAATVADAAHMAFARFVGNFDN